LQRYINAKVPGVSDNMHVLYSLDEEPIEAWKLWRKMVQGVWEQFVTPRLSIQIFFAPFNLMAAATLAFALRDKSRHRFRILAATVLVFGFHFLTISLRGSEFRFLDVPNPMMVWGAALFLASLPMMHSSRRWTTATVAALAVLGSTDVGLAMLMRKEANQERVARAGLARIFDETVKPEDGVVLDVRWFAEPDILVGYVLRPRPVLYVDRSYDYTPDELASMVRNVAGAWLLARGDSPLLRQLPLEQHEPVRRDLPPPFEQHALYKLGTWSGKQPQDTGVAR
jgi:hypothetical protein